ncbi:uncharacterized protein LOC131248314 isoform X2 [Magnolia sinica]|uniref:uncharacterized protein LOC131248314 isoform X2 n=1 Tax=Magnolia sinica TaxID=86752 RepID=UPI00265B28DB|nr:uncharacterized protein LOC131248314 isoform X2 [Magnolia sinica]
MLGDPDYSKALSNEARDRKTNLPEQRTKNLRYLKSSSSLNPSPSHTSRSQSNQRQRNEDGDNQEQLLVHGGDPVRHLHRSELQRPQHQETRKHRPLPGQAHRRILPQAQEERRRRLISSWNLLEAPELPDLNCSFGFLGACLDASSN